MLFFLFQKSLRNLNHGQYGVTYIVHLENIDQFLLKAQIANLGQYKLQIETYCPFKDSTYVSIESFFFATWKYFLKNLIKDNTG